MTHPPITNPAVGECRQRCGLAGVRQVVCYLRTANQGTVGMRLLGRQRAKLQRACAAHGWAVVGWIEELHQSGATLDRPGLRHALALLADGQADGLVCTDLERLAVDPRVAGQLQALGVRQGWRLLTLSPDQPKLPALAVPVAVDDSSGGGLRRGRGGAHR
jgi:hypothetical protein